MLWFAETFLRLQAASIRASDEMTPGLIRYDRRLGWRLEKDWRGTHDHHDFSVQYTTNADGFRGPDFTGTRPTAVLLGDSFTFGIGVDNDETFAAHLRDRCDTHLEVINLGVPGYSTDQQLLLLEESIADLRPEKVVVVVCLINDIFDNDRLFPLQAMQGKPRFELTQDKQLSLSNVPVPQTLKPASEMRENLASLVVGEHSDDRGVVARWMGNREICRRLGWFRASFTASDRYFANRFEQSLDLSLEIVARLQETAEASGAAFTIALLPGRSYIENEEGYSFLYQDYLRREVIRRAAEHQIDTIDLASELRKYYEQHAEPLYHPHDGHLNRRGHQLLGRLLLPSLHCPSESNEKLP